MADRHFTPSQPPMYRVKGADQKEYGPVSFDQIRQWIQENRLNRFSLVQKEGEPSWKPLDQFSEFADLLGPVPPAPLIPGQPTPAGIPGPGAYTPVPDPQRAASLVKGPAIAIMILAILGIVLSIVSVAARSQFANAVLAADRPLPPEMLQYLRELSNKGVGLVDYASTGLSIALNAIMFFGALKMQRLENWGLAMAASIIAMLPCMFCCCIGIPIGIWAVVVLNKPEVKASFR